MITYRQLEAFRAIMIHGSVTAAAERLRISQPAVSKTLAGLEREIGYALFTRIKRRLAPTREARLLESEVTRFYHNLERVTEVAREIRERELGDLLIHSTSALGRSVLPDVIAMFMKRHAKVRIAFHVRSSSYINQKMVDQQIDLGFSMMPFEHPSIVSEELSSAAAVCVVPDGHRLARRKVIRPADLRGERFLSFPLDGRMRHLIDAAFEQERIERRLDIDVYSSADACALAARGLGVSIVDPFTARDHMNEGVIMVPFEPRIRYLFRAMRPRYRKPSRLADEFLDSVKAYLKAKGWA
ncbi:LysR substrate-binding domain-containing protein [Bradyrhizobium sp. LHD-71]|uniref:LysR substrate-binding domain-containing protein n=1 Tax=Bradyrhizobium sp. LHD-71 TaxID=3072141 RepID=UPI00280CBFF9|nr:LysR substrate-binding domain-containing protein [Bradyrhizobium sp. LHD-71]MDQ8727522.1 LysR substrate-binding domain-containing protein [Bradyrhizobium sp. LHD-71]